MIPVYMDEHVPKAITIGLRMRGIDVLTVQEDGLSSSILYRPYSLPPF